MARGMPTTPATGRDERVTDVEGIPDTFRADTR